MVKLRFYNSSSFKLASFFTALVALSIGAVIYFLLLSQNLNGQEDVGKLQAALNYLGVAIIVLLGAISAVGYVVGRFVVNLINTISDTANDIMQTGDLSRRIPLDTQWDDLSKLALVLNQMFGRIEQLMNGIRQVSDNIAHDLRTPLMRLRNQLEELQDDEAAERLLKEADHLLAIFNGLLRIANIEAGKSQLEMAPIALHDVLRDVVELYEPMAEEKQQKLRVHLSACHIQGDRDLLFQAVVNLLDNAIKFTPNGGEISIWLEQINDRALITMSDSGSGVPAEEREAVFRRFYRTEASRTTPGNGLGLSMVSAIVTYHKGVILLDDNQPGLIVRIGLPVTL